MQKALERQGYDVSCTNPQPRSAHWAIAHSMNCALHRGEGPLHVHRMIERQAIPPVDDVFQKAPIDLHN
ncbi:hypothetical protein AB9F46_35315, partial [Rhizobium leguminosarum]|uniref:hypothetical protein n=1 Tax=Rhizobium leguminosarum TaxID=384 RepID=UPI003F956318